MPTFPINLAEALLSQIEKRASKNYLTTKEQLEDIIRRSMLSYNKRRSRRKLISGQTDDKLVNIFSRDRRGRKPKKKN